MLSIKNIMNKGEAPINKTTNPWLIEQVKNGLKAVNIKILTDLLRPDKKLPAYYFENDRIYGTGAFSENGVLRVMDLFDELREVTPNTIGYIFENKKYLYHSDGILRKDIRTHEEEYFSDKTLRNENVDNFFRLTEPEVYECDNDREEILSKSTELQEI